MVVIKTSSWFSERWFLRISSISKEQQQIYATKYPSLLGLRWNLQHLIMWKRWKFPPTSLLQKILPMHSNGETTCKNTSENSNNCQKTRNYSNYVMMRVWGLSHKDITSILLILKRTTDATFNPRIYDASQWKMDSYKRMDSQEYEDRPSLEHISLLSWWSILYRSSNTQRIIRRF